MDLSTISIDFIAWDIQPCLDDRDIYIIPSDIMTKSSYEAISLKKHQYIPLNALKYYTIQSPAVHRLKEGEEEPKMLVLREKKVQSRDSSCRWTMANLATTTTCRQTGTPNTRK